MTAISLSAPASDKIRIAIALSALKFKPPGQCFESYVLDLHAAFPSCRRCSQEEDPWRDRALALETSLAELKEKYENDHLKLLALRADASAPTAKKKVRRKPQEGVAMHLPAAGDAVVDPFVECPELLAFLGDSSTSIVSAFDALAKLKPSTAQSRATPLAFLIPTATRALETLGSLVVSVLPGASAASSLPASQVLKDASGLLRHVLTTAVPLMVLKVQSQLKSSSRSGKLSAEVALDDFLSLLASVLLVPLIRAFKPLSRLYLAAVFDGTLCDTGYTGSAAGADVRTYVAIVLRQAASTLGMLCASADTDPATGVLQRCARSTVERLALEAVRELEALSVHDDAPLRQPSSDDTLQRERRVWRLADKDAQCFLCASLHTFFDMSVFSSSSYPNPKRPGEPSLSDPSTAEDAHLLRDGMLTSLSALLRRRSQPWTHLDSQNTADDSSKDNGGREDDGCGGKQVHLEAGKITDQVGHGMILSVIEKAWLSGFVDGTLILDSRGI